MPLKTGKRVKGVGLSLPIDMLDDLAKLAEQNRMPVSMLVRNILLDHFDAQSSNYGSIPVPDNVRQALIARAEKHNTSLRDLATRYIEGAMLLEDAIAGESKSNG